MLSAAALLAHLKRGAIIIHDLDSDYREGIERSWYFDAEANTVMCRESDTIAGSFEHTKPVSDDEMLAILAQIPPGAVEWLIDEHFPKDGLD